MPGDDDTCLLAASADDIAAASGLTAADARPGGDGTRGTEGEGDDTSPARLSFGASGLDGERRALSFVGGGTRKDGESVLGDVLGSRFSSAARVGDIGRGSARGDTTKGDRATTTRDATGDTVAGDSGSGLAPEATRASCRNDMSWDVMEMTS